MAECQPHSGKKLLCGTGSRATGTVALPLSQERLSVTFFIFFRQIAYRGLGACAGLWEDGERMTKRRQKAEGRRIRMRIAECGMGKIAGPESAIRGLNAGACAN